MAVRMPCSGLLAEYADQVCSRTLARASVAAAVRDPGTALPQVVAARAQNLKTLDPRIDRQYVFDLADDARPDRPHAAGSVDDDGDVFGIDRYAGVVRG